MFKKLKGLLSRRAKRDYLPGSNGGWQMLSGTINTSGSSSDIDKDMSDGELINILSASAAVAACVNKYISASHPVRYIVIDEDNEPAPDHPVQKVLDEPNAEMDAKDIQTWIAQMFLLTGVAYLGEYRVDGQLEQLIPYPSSIVQRKKLKSGDVVFKIENGTSSQIIAEHDITKIRNIDPANPSGHLSPVKSALRSIRLDSEHYRYIFELIVNTPIPGLVLNVGEQTYSPEHKDSIKAKLKDICGNKNRGKPLLVQGKDAGPKEFKGLTDLDWPGLNTQIQADICSVLGVPIQITGLRGGLDASTYSNYETSLRSFATQTMVPYWDMVASSLTRCLITREANLGITDDNKTYKVIPDTSAVPALQENKTAKAEMLMNLVDRGIIGPERARADLGYSEEDAPESNIDNQEE